MRIVSRTAADVRGTSYRVILVGDLNAGQLQS